MKMSFNESQGCVYDDLGELDKKILKHLLYV